MARSDRAAHALFCLTGLATVLLAALLSPVAMSAAPDDVSITAHYQELEEVVVTGRVPGPPLWRVSRGDHVLWILPLVDAYPRDIEWDSTRVEELIAQSQEFIERPIANWGISTMNPLTLARLMSTGRRYSRLRDGQYLSDFLPADLYQRYEALKSRYFASSSSNEKLRVSVAGLEMQREIMGRQGLAALSYRRLGSPEPITRNLNRWLKQNKKIRRTSPVFRTIHRVGFGELGALGDAVEEASATEAYARWELSCFEKVLVYFEMDIERVKRRANDWAQGRADALIDPTPLRGVGDACTEPPLIPEDSPTMEKLRQEAPELVAKLAPMLTGKRREGEAISKQRWLEAAEAALARNTVTFSVLAVDDVIREGGLVSQLREKGYEVQVSAR